jgi:hypothetical protein
MPAKPIIKFIIFNTLSDFSALNLKHKILNKILPPSKLFSGNKLKKPITKLTTAKFKKIIFLTLKRKFTKLIRKQQGFITHI